MSFPPSRFSTTRPATRTTGRRSTISVSVAAPPPPAFAASFAFAAYLKGFANYVGTYAGLAGVMIALIFVYIMSAIFLLGAEFNSALKRGRDGDDAADR